MSCTAGVESFGNMQRRCFLAKFTDGLRRAGSPIWSASSAVKPWKSIFCVDACAQSASAASDQSVLNLSCISKLLRKLGSQNLCFFYGGRHGQEISSVGHECFGNGPVEVSLPSRLIGEHASNMANVDEPRRSANHSSGRFRFAL